jgi:hypothetical protein
VILLCPPSLPTTKTGTPEQRTATKETDAPAGQATQTQKSPAKMRETKEKPTKGVATEF